MKIYEVKGLDCREKVNKLKLAKEIKKLLNTEEMPTKARLEKIVNSLAKKYKTNVNMVRTRKSRLQISIALLGGYSCFLCDSYYEALCKYILLVKAFKEENLV